MSLIKKKGKRGGVQAIWKSRTHVQSAKDNVHFGKIWTSSIQYGAHLSLPTGTHTGNIVLEVDLGKEAPIVFTYHEPKLTTRCEVHNQQSQYIDRTKQRTCIIRCDALALLHDHLPPVPFVKYVFFPEPWSNTTNIDVYAQTLVALEPLLTKKHNFLCYRRARIRLDVHTLFENTHHWSSSHEMYAPRPQWRPMSKYETKGIKEGRSIFDLHWQYTPPH